MKVIIHDLGTEYDEKFKATCDGVISAYFPSFIFILFADIFFVIISIFKGGIFRGWLSKK